MMDRRAFLSRMAVTLGAIALAPSVVEALSPARPVDWADEFVDGDLIPLDVTKQYGSAMLDDASYDMRSMLRRQEMLRLLGQQPTPVRFTARWQGRT